MGSKVTDYMKQYTYSSQVLILSDCQFSEMVNTVENSGGTGAISFLLMFSFSCHSIFTYLIRQIYVVAIFNFQIIVALEFSILPSLTKFYKRYFPPLKHTPETLSGFNTP